MSYIKVYRKVYSESGEIKGKYIEINLKEEDGIIIIRPPLLHFENTQFIRIRFGNKDCIKIHPETFFMFYKNFDGDEAHIYSVFDGDSIVECELWDILPILVF